MGEEHVLTPREAETVVDERIERFGPGALPRVNVTAAADGDPGTRPSSPGGPQRPQSSSLRGIA